MICRSFSVIKGVTSIVRVFGLMTNVGGVGIGFPIRKGVRMRTSVSVVGAVLHGLLDGTVGFDCGSSRVLIGTRVRNSGIVIDMGSAKGNVDRRSRGGLLGARARFDGCKAGGRRNSKLNLLLYRSFTIGGNKRL